jgi:hypothetical protein
LAEPDQHLGPFAVCADAQGRVSAASCSKLSRSWSPNARMAYLENDAARNVRFYERYRFEVVGRDEVLGVECTFTPRKRTDLQSSPLTIDSTVYPEL